MTTRRNEKSAVDLFVHRFRRNGLGLGRTLVRSNLIFMPKSTRFSMPGECRSSRSSGSDTNCTGDDKIIG